MSERAFTAGVRPGGLTTSTEIRILLCCCIAAAKYPPAETELESALLKAELVNYFELAACLSELKQNGLITLNGDGCCVLSPTGKQIADTLQGDIPPSVRDRALLALTELQNSTRNTHYYQAQIKPCENGYRVECTMHDMGQPTFSFSIYMPDLPSAEQAKERFCKKGANLYRLMLSVLTGENALLEVIVQGLTV